VCRRTRNASHRSTLCTYIKKVVAAVEAGDHEAAATAFKAAVPVIDRMAGKGILHKNKAARHKSRLAARLGGCAPAPCRHDGTPPPRLNELSSSSSNCSNCQDQFCYCRTADLRPSLTLAFAIRAPHTRVKAQLRAQNRYAVFLLSLTR